MHIFVFEDYGSSEVCVRQTLECFRRLCQKSGREKYTIEVTNGKRVQDGCLFEDENGGAKGKILCIGGGFDLGYIKSLGQLGCDQIRKFVENGGYYLGICAGAYFAADYIEFDLNGPLEVKGERWLKFYSGKAIGPVNKGFEYNNSSKSIAIRVETCEPRRDFHVYLNGGCFFSPDQKTDNSEVLAVYNGNGNGDLLLDDKKIAIVQCRVGEGKCLLSGVHFEFGQNHDQTLEESVDATLRQEFEKNGYGLVESLLARVFEDF